MTKVPILLGHGFWGFQFPKLDRYSFWSMVHEARTDFSMWLELVFLLVVGGGRWSLDGGGCHLKSSGIDNMPLDTLLMSR
jgi:hypothetical protein